jgi:HEAT repeat protein
MSLGLDVTNVRRQRKRRQEGLIPALFFSVVAFTSASAQEAAAARLLEQLDAPSAAVQEAASDSLAALGAQVVPVLVARLEQGNAAQRRWAAITLGRMGRSAHPLATPVLVRALADPDRWVRPRAVAALAAIGEPAVAPLAGALADSATQFWAASALSRIGPAAAPAVPQLINAGTTGPAVARAEAILALGAIGEPASAAVPVVTSALDDPDPWVRSRAAAVLPRFGPAAAPARAALARAASDPHPDVRKVAAESLAALDQP